jgi:deoxyribonuclease-1
MAYLAVWIYLQNMRHANPWDTWIFWVPITLLFSTIGGLCWWFAVWGHYAESRARIWKSWRGARLLGGIGLVAGVVGPTLIWPSSNLGPLLGILIAGPLGFVVGALGALVLFTKRSMVKTLLAIGLNLLLVSLAFAQGQTTIRDYETARRVYFWNQLYEDGGSDLYCGVRFRKGQRLSVEHVYAADWIAEKFGCANRHCEHPAYKFAEADLHNLWPALGAINSSRGKAFFGEVNGSKPTLPPSLSDLKCAYKKLRDVVEPRRNVWGDIARSLFYMHVEYGLPLHRMLPVLKVWHRKDPVNQNERWRNKRIFDLQGTRNRFVEHPTLAEELQ